MNCSCSFYESPPPGETESPPPGVPPDLQSGVKKCPNLFMICGFAIRSNQA